MACEANEAIDLEKGCFYPMERRLFLLLQNEGFNISPEPRCPYIQMFSAK